MTDKSQEWLELLQGSEKSIFDYAFEVQSIAYALKRVGMDKIASELTEISRGLGTTQKNIQNATHLKIDADLKNANEMTAAILNGIIAGAEHEKRKGKS